MNVKDCANCSYIEKRSYIRYGEPRGENAHGFKYTYHFCTKHQRWVRKVYKCEERTKEWNKEKD